MTLQATASALSCDWESYVWKNEIVLQSGRVLAHFAEAIDDDFHGEHHPLHMLERALVLVAFSVRRMCEKRLVTDGLAKTKISLHAFPATPEFRAPYISQSGGMVFQNYDFEKPTNVSIPIVKLANEIIHSSQLMVLRSAGIAEDGLLVTSDFSTRQRVLHLPMNSFSEFVDRVLHDRITLTHDSWDPKTGQLTAIRK
jgi:hypothetical protein